MHNIATHSITLENQPSDINQTPADVLFLSTADTELNCLASAYQQSEKKISLRLANLNNINVENYCKTTVAKSKMLILRCLGGKGYFANALQKIHATCVENSVALIVLSGDEKYDGELEIFNTVEKKTAIQFFEYLAYGGIENCSSMLELAYCQIHKKDCSNENCENVLPARAFLKAGIFYGGKTNLTINEIDINKNQQIVAIIFYRSLLLGANIEPVESLCKALAKQNLNIVPIFVSSLKDEFSQITITNIFKVAKPSVVINLTSFAVSNPSQKSEGTVLETNGAIVLQAVLASTTFENWQKSAQGLGARDLAMNIALPEVDGRIFTRAIAFKSKGEYDKLCEINLIKHVASESRVKFVADLAKKFTTLRAKEIAKRKVALILANYPNRDGRLGNGVGLDTPQSTWNILANMKKNGYKVELPKSDTELINQLKQGITNEKIGAKLVHKVLPIAEYKKFFASLPEKTQQKIKKRWGEAEKDPFYLAGEKSFALPILPLGNVLACIQPARGYNIDSEQSFHSPDLPPPHNYLAFYFYLRFIFAVDVIAHVGKHGNLEWLPGKALSPSENCFPENIMGPTPHIYPFIVNDPGEGTQAKRRTNATIIDHLTPPLTRAETYGALQNLENLVDEYYEAQVLDTKRAHYLAHEIFEIMEREGLMKDLAAKEDEASLQKLDAYLCELKEAQIRDGLHIFGESPKSQQRIDLAIALARLPRSLGDSGDDSLLNALAKDFGFNFNPLDCDYAEKWQEEKPKLLQDVSNSAWRSCGDTIERMELFSIKLLAENKEYNLPNTKKVIEKIKTHILPAIDSCGKNELAGFITALNGEFVAPGPSGAPSRGRADVLPTGRNFFSVDSRSIPTPAAWHLGKKSAELLLERHKKEHGCLPKTLGLSVWGTSNMRTGGDDIAQAMALIGARPKWDLASRRVIGFEIITLAELARPRVDVTLRISGFFRDAFPAQIELFDKATRAIADLEEEPQFNPLAENIKAEKQKLIEAGIEENLATQTAGFRIFGSKPGSYGAGLQALIDENGWQNRDDFARGYLAFGGYAYGGGGEGKKQEQQFKNRLAKMEAVVHNQDNREHDILDSDDYYQFQGGMAASVEYLRGAKVPIYHNDHSRPERPIIKTLEEEIAKVVRSRVTNPKWIKGVMRHKYKGAFEMAASVDYLFAYAATTGAVKDHHFEAVYEAFLANEEVQDFLKQNNEHAYKDIANRLLQALEKGLWTTRRNSIKLELEKILEKINESTS